MLHVIFDAVVDVRYLADIVAAVLHLEVLLQFGPASQHQLQGLTVMQLDVSLVAGGREKIEFYLFPAMYSNTQSYFRN